VTGETARVKVNEAAKLAAAWDPAAPDENTSYYLAKLRELAAKFLPFAEGDGLIVVSEDSDEAPDRPAQESLDLSA
jgi:hypothetical protein